VKKIKGQRTHRRNFDGGKELPSNVGFEEPSEKTGIGGPVASGLGDRHRTLKYIRFTHVQRGPFEDFETRAARILLTVPPFPADCV
jgi:hypothetical protein